SRNALGELCDCVLAIGRDQLGQRREQARLREAVAIDAIVARFRPRLTQIAQGGLLLVEVGKRVAGDRERGWAAHEAQRNLRANQGGTHLDAPSSSTCRELA